MPLGLLLASPVVYYVYRGFVPEYRAAHLLEPNRDYVVFQGILAQPRDWWRVEQQLVVNAIVLDPVLADPEVCKAPSLRDPATRDKELRDRMSVSGNHVLSVSYKDPDPVHAAAVCNAIVESYLRQRQAFDNRRLSELESWLRPAMDRWENEVAGHQARVRELSQQTRGFDPFSEVSRLEDGAAVMTGLFAQLTQVKGDEEVLRARIEAEQARRDRGELDGAIVDIMPALEEIDQLISRDSAVLRLRQRAAQKAEQMRRMEDSDLVRINREWYNSLASDVEATNKELAEAEKVAKEQALVELGERSRKQQLDDRSLGFLQLQEELAMLMAKREALEAAFEAEKQRLEQFAGESVDLYFAQQQYHQAASILEKLSMRIASLRTERQRGPSMQTLARATPPVAPLEDMPVKKMVVFGGGAFMVPFFLALLWELAIKRIATPDALDARKLLPVIGEVARLPVGSFASGRKRIFEESVDALRANLLLSSELSEARSIAITSAMSGEGKSSLSSQLAVSIAKATGETVLLIDADLRNPDQHHLFGLEMGLGLVGVLTGRVKLEAAIDRSLGGLVHVLPAGYLDASPHRLLSPSALRDLIDFAQNELGYRYIVFDTAPVLSAGETLAVTAEVDATLLCVMRDVSRVSNLERTVKRLETTGAALAGMVFNGTPARAYAYRYGDYRYGDLNRQSSLESTEIAAH